MEGAGVALSSCTLHLLCPRHLPRMCELPSPPGPAGADYDDCPAQPAAGDDAAPQLGLLRCLASPAPLQHPAFAELRDGTELVAESFRLSFAECAARGECLGPGGAGPLPRLCTHSCGPTMAAGRQCTAANGSCTALCLGMPLCAGHASTSLLPAPCSRPAGGARAAGATGARPAGPHWQRRAGRGSAFRGGAAGALAAGGAHRRGQAVRRGGRPGAGGMASHWAVRHAAHCALPPLRCAVQPGCHAACSACCLPNSRPAPSCLGRNLFSRHCQPVLAVLLLPAIHRPRVPARPPRPPPPTPHPHPPTPHPNPHGRRTCCTRLPAGGTSRCCARCWVRPAPRRWAAPMAAAWGAPPCTAQSSTGRRPPRSCS